MTGPDRSTAPPVRLLSVADVAERCGVSQDSVRRAVNRGDLAASKAFGRVLVREQDLDEYLKATRIGGTQVCRRRSPAPARAPASGGLRELTTGTQPRRGAP